jgi:ABC-type phosphate/phosphonate transport system ATPase subunit
MAKTLPTKKKNAAAVALSKLGASKGGKARAKSLSAKERSRIAKAAAQARWSKE